MDASVTAIIVAVSVLLAVIAPIVILALGLGLTEYRTLKDDVPGNHITAVWRALWAKEPGAILLALLALMGVITWVVAILAFIAGHIFWCSCPA
jgi:hypothetical protein